MKWAKPGNRLTHRPCKVGKFKSEVLEAKRQNAGTRTTESILVSECQKKTLGIYDFQVSHASIHQIIHPFFFTSRSISAKVFVLYSPTTLSHPPHPTPLLTIREHVQHVDNGNKFRSPCVITPQEHSPPPPPTPLVDHKRACATC